jgi:hypothetical protein
MAMQVKQKVAFKRATEKAISSLLEEIISGNRNLHHLDLSYTGLSRQIV